LAGEPLSGQLLSFTADGNQTQLAKIVQSASTPDSYEIQVVGPDGAVEIPGDRRLSCDAVDPHPSPSLTLTPVPPSSIGSSHSPSPSPKPTHSTPRPSTPAPTSTAAGHPAPSSSSAPVVVPVPPVFSQPVTSSKQSPPAKRSSAAHGPSSQPSVTSTPTPTGSKVVAESPRLVPVLGLATGIQRSALLIVAVFAVAMAALVGTTVRNARRR
jgi:hypothetical protein